jgi:acetyl esterase/lipase
LCALDLDDLPPACVLTAGFDPLCNAKIASAGCLRHSSAAVRRRHCADQTHDFLVKREIAETPLIELGLIVAAPRDGLDSR